MEQSLRRRRRRRQDLLLRGIAEAALIVWGIFGLVGLFTMISWLVGAVMGNREQAYGQGVGIDVEAGSVSGVGAAPGGWESGGVVGGSSGSWSAEQGAGDENSGVQPYQFSEEERAECRRLYQENPLFLVLVNKETELDADFDSSLRKICKGRLEASDWMYKDLVDLLAAASREGYTYWIASAYRSRKRQQELVDEDVQRFMGWGMSYSQALERTLEETMPAGHSEHETGLALDLLCSGNEDMDVSQAAEPGNHWLLEHCAEYGFILRYPKDREDITGIAYEPWHFRYVGKGAAQFIMERGITLEEFHAGIG